MIRSIMSLKKVAVLAVILISAVGLFLATEKEAYGYSCTEVTFERDMGYFCTNAHNSCIVVTSKDCHPST